MATINRCPACGEQERLRGQSSGEDIEVTCEACGARWLRGAARCNSCGSDDAVVRPQVMTRQPRGNQVAIVGRRQLPLCPHCDAGAITESLTANRPVPETYVSVFLFGRGTSRYPPAPPEPSAKDSAAGVGADRVIAPTSKASTRDTRKSPAPPAGTARPGAARATPNKPKQPTVRQAIEAFLAGHPEADSLAMLFLGQHLGPASRLEVLDRPGAADSLTTWFDTTWTDRQAERRQAAAAAIAAAVDHWRAEGWLTQDPATALR